MFEFEPDKRITLNQIPEHPWYNEEVYDQEEVFKIIVDPLIA